MYFDDPVEFETFLAPIGGEVLIRPAIGALFTAEIRMQRLANVGLFSVSANTFKAVKDSQQDFYGLTIPLGSPFEILDSSRNQIYESPCAHMRSPGQAFNFTAKRKCNFLATIFFAKPVSDYSRKLLQSDSQELPLLGAEVSFFNQTGSILLRSVAKTWSALNNNKPTCKMALAELEDDLLASFVIYANAQSQAEKSNHCDNLYPLSRAEDYIIANLQNPIMRDQLAEVSGRSIRTLSRAFEKKYGMGPIAFIKQRRLDAAYLDLLSAKPDTSSVTQVAYSYGFAHVGKFAIEYQKVFGETPSTSLVK